jgi:hypothetical protein
MSMNWTWRILRRKQDEMINVHAEAEKSIKIAAAENRSLYEKDGSSV